MIFYNITLLAVQILSDTTTVGSRNHSNVYMNEYKWKLPTSVKCHGANPHWNHLLTVQLMPMEYFTYNSKKNIYMYNFWTLWVIFLYKIQSFTKCFNISVAPTFIFFAIISMHFYCPLVVLFYTCKIFM